MEKSNADKLVEKILEKDNIEAHRCLEKLVVDKCAKRLKKVLKNEA